MSAKVNELNKELDIACYVRDAAAKTMNTNFCVVTVTFRNAGGARSGGYCYRASCALNLSKGDLVLCQTVYGLSLGEVKSVNSLQADVVDIRNVPKRWIIQVLQSQKDYDNREQALNKSYDKASDVLYEAKNSVAHVTSMIQIQHDLEQKEHKARVKEQQTEAYMFMQDIAEVVELSVAFASGKILVIPSLEELREEAKKAFS